MAYLAIAVLGNSFAHAQKQTFTASVEFGNKTYAKSMSGFLLSLDGTVPANLITPLKPVFWRIGPDLYQYDQAIFHGAQPQVVLSEGYGYPFSNWNGKGAPWENNWQPWENHVRTTAQQFKGKNVYWDIWNEPDARDWNKTIFWSGTRAQFFETYRRAYKILRQELGSSALIGGPSFANYELLDIKAFLAFCQANQIEVNLLSWHELTAADQNIPAVASHIATVKTLLPAYPALKTQQILINESVGEISHLKPGDALGYLYTMEKAGVDGSMKGCWPASNGSHNCFNGSLDGLIDPASRTPRAVWWAYKLYADSLNTRVKTVSSNTSLAILASQNPKQVVFAYFPATGTIGANVTLTLKQLSAIGIGKGAGGSFAYSLYQIPETGEAPLQTPKLLTTARLTYTGNAATIPLTNILPHAAYYLTVSP